MTAGILAALSPAATTASVLYSTDSEHTASSVLSVAERGNSAATYRVGHKDYTQKLTMDANTYKFRRGNPISTYKMEINPGISRQDATPGLLIGSTDLAKSAYVLDTVVETATITNYVKVKKCTSLQIDTNSVTGTFQGGETLTGGTSGLTATFRGLGTSLNIEVADIASGDTSLKFVDGLALNGNPGYFVLSDGITGYNPEIILAGAATFYSGTTGGANVAVTRAQFGTTAAAHPSGQLASIYTDSGTTTTINEGGQFAAGDTTLTVTDGTTIVTGTHIRVGNEIMLATGVTGNDVTVTRGVWGTTDAAHNDGSTVTPMVQGSQALIQWFDTSETLTGGTTNATATTQFTATSSAVYTTQFTWGTVAGREIVPSQFTMDVDRTYLFDQSDSSNTGLPLRFSDTQEGTGATPTAGTEYTTGVTKAGTAGTDGTIEIIPTVNTPDPLYYYAEGTASAAPDTQYSSGIDIVTDPQFTEIYLYDVDGTWVTGDTFTIGTATQTVGTVTGGKYGWVSAWSGSDVFVDTPRGQGADRANATVSSVTAATDLETKDYIYYDVAISANTTNEHKGLVVGPNSHLIVYASSANLSFQVNGFANTVSDWEAEQYNQTTGSAGGGA